MTEQDFNDEISEALQDAICDGDGRPRTDALQHHLAKRGLVIVPSTVLSAARALFAETSASLRECWSLHTAEELFALDALRDAIRVTTP